MNNRIIKKAFSRTQLGHLFALLLIVVPLNFMYFLMLPYEKRILTIMSAPYAIPTIIVNILYSFVSAFVVFILIMNSAGKTRSLTRKDHFFIPGAFILLRVLFDLLSGLLVNFMSKSVEQLVDFSTILFWALFFAFTFKYLKVKIDNKKVFAIMSASVIILLSVLIIIYDKSLAETFYTSLEKYYPLSVEIDIISKTLGFRGQVFNMIIEDTVIVAACWITGIANYNYYEKKEKEKKPAFKVVSFAVGALFVLIGLTSFKYFVFPFNSISNTSIHGSNSIHYNEKVIEVSTKRPTWYRFDAYGDENLVYCKEIATIRYGDEILLKTDKHIRPEYKSIKTVYDVDGIEVYAVLDNNVFAYVKDGKAYAYRAKDLPGAERDDILISALEKMYLEEPDWEEFENVCTYLLRYDPDFIKPILERYSAGEFYQYEPDYNLSIMPTYVQQISLDLLG